MAGRGVMHYQTGTDNVTGVVPKQPLPPALVPPQSPSIFQQVLQAMQRPPAAVPQVTPEQLQQLPLLPSQQPSEPAAPAVRVPQGSRTVPRGVVQSPADVSAIPAAALVPPNLGPSGLGQLASGNFAAAAANLQSSPFTAWLAGINQAAQTQQRVQDVGTGPSVFDWIQHTFTGTQGDTSLAQRADAAKTFRDPVVQQHLMTDPVALEAAEKDPINYAQTVQDPNFKAYMQHIQEVHRAVQAGGIVHTDAYGSIGPKTPDDPHQIARTVATTGTTPAEALAVHEPEKLSRDEYIRVLSGMPTKIAQMLLESQLRSAQIFHLTPQQQITRDYVQTLRANLESEQKKITAEKDPIKQQAMKDEYEQKTLPEYLKNIGTIAGSFQRFLDTDR